MAVLQRRVEPRQGLALAAAVVVVEWGSVMQPQLVRGLQEAPEAAVRALKRTQRSSGPLLGVQGEGLRVSRQHGSRCKTEHR